MKRIYLDYNATTPVAPEVIEAMLPYFYDIPGNPGNTGHYSGREAEEAVENARDSVARMIGAEAGDILFTSCATESIGLGIRAALNAMEIPDPHIITVATEHKAVLETIGSMEREGITATILPVNTEGIVDLNQLVKSIRPNTALIAIMYANNETGALQPVEEIGRIARDRGVLFFCDATQAIGKIPVDVNKMRFDLMPCSAHKFYGPKGTGALYLGPRVRRDKLAPLFRGGSQERGLRPGTLNVPGIAGIGKCSELCMEALKNDPVKVKGLRDLLEKELLELEGAVINGGPGRRLPNTINISFAGINGQMLLESLGAEVAVSTGSACNTGSSTQSYVLKAMGLSPDRISGSLRFSLGRFNTKEEIMYAAGAVKERLGLLSA